MDYVKNQHLTFQDTDATNQKGDGPDDDVHVQFKEVRLLVYTVELQWLEHRWLVYHFYFELVLGSLGKHSIATDSIIFGII